MAEPVAKLARTVQTPVLGSYISKSLDCATVKKTCPVSGYTIKLSGLPVTLQRVVLAPVSKFISYNILPGSSVTYTITCAFDWIEETNTVAMSRNPARSSIFTVSSQTLPPSKGNQE